jgi:hypothetical protein
MRGIWSDAIHANIQFKSTTSQLFWSEESQELVGLALNLEMAVPMRPIKNRIKSPRLPDHLIFAEPIPLWIGGICPVR